MWVRQQAMLKPDNYTESCMINEADGWRGRNVWYLGRSVWYQNQLYTMAQKASELLEKESSTVLADTGYYNGTEIKNCVDAGMNVYIKKAKANNATKDNEFRKEKFIYNGETDEYTCPAGDRLRFLKILRRMA